MSPAVMLASAFLATAPAAAHRLDEYLQATTIEVERARVRVQIRLAPGVEVFPVVFAAIDRDANGVVSADEQRAYAARVIGDISLRVDGRAVRLQLVSSEIAPRKLLEAGRGEIVLRLEGDVSGAAASRQLTFENRHQSRISVYLVNALTPGDPNIRLLAQQRSYDQSSYRLDYIHARSGAPDESDDRRSSRH